jgi:hypothetical protein
MPDNKPVRIPLPPDEAVADLLRVKPTEDMPRPGARKGKQGNKKKARRN